ncbi:unnamed protein product [Angiostrongylus costaricensis]|uniref:Ig-like domain-containing protein n=1 Tax=Angiostrongylus costaricensis TaxID=334426 RepID=A0A158PM47_ANGCS|nr:unnamed protein product [Angiostrongylus costaricensis]
MFRDRPIKTTETGLKINIKEGDLSITDVNKHDSGWYVCWATSPSGTPARASAFLDVLYAPKALPSHKQLLTIGIGQNSTLICAVDANPKPNLYSWSKNGHFITTSRENPNADGAHPSKVCNHFTDREIGGKVDVVLYRTCSRHL